MDLDVLHLIIIHGIPIDLDVLHLIIIHAMTQLSRLGNGRYL